MKYYIDFDNTMFDTEKFYCDLLKITENYGINEDKINNYYKNNLKNELFNPLKIINKLSEKHKLRDELIKEVNTFLKDISSYLYDDTIEFLEYLKSNNYELILLTYGDFDYQNEKVNKSGIKDYFDKIIITSKHKALLNLDYEHSVFIDDNKVQLEGLLKTGAKVIRIKRSGNKHYLDEIKGVIEFNDFKELINFMTNEKNNLFNC